MSPRLAFAVESAYLAGRSTLAYFQSGTGFSLKGDGSPVTMADTTAENILRSRIESAYPGENVLGEEFGGDRFDDSWILDPIDGTKSFICSVPLYATLISYEVDGEPIVAAAYFPAVDEMVYAEQGGGCYLNGRPVCVSNVSDLAHSTICCGGIASMKKSGKLDEFALLAEKSMTSRTWCDAFGHCMVATGRAEAMIDPVVARWDISSVRLLVKEAGGSATDFSGGSHPKTELVTTNGFLMQRVLGEFSQ